MKAEARKRIEKYGICALLAVVTFAAFASVSQSSFIVFDDGTYVFSNNAVQNGVTWTGIKWAFQNFDASNWHPVTWLSHMLDCQFFALDPAGPHLTNLAFHIANTVLLFLLLQNLTGRLWAAAFVATLFGIHPMHVESVGWVAERKDVLSAFFFLLTLLAYARYVELSQPTVTGQTVPAVIKWKRPFRGRKSWVIYGLTLFFFALGLMAKSMIVTLPFILLLLDFWPLQRAASKWGEGGRFKALTFQRLLIEKIPFFILAAATCVVTYIAQNSGGAVKPELEYSLSDRLIHLPVSYAWYIWKLFWPVNLSVFYLLRPGQDSIAEMLPALLLLLVVTSLALAGARKLPFIIVGWFWFLGMLVPVIGLVQVGNQAY
ncbi:MAG TPA: hypothetical protein VNV43_05840, partial [Candidatus Acidoferrales bacterium]|nr:hypothetical protein [Candidatus Acidoferrales bacterium]